MNILGIIKLLNENRISDALEDADKIPFSDRHLLIYNRLKEAYIAGLRGQELLDWAGQMKGLLSLYNSKSDKIHRWHHLDKKKLKEKFSDLWDDKSELIKVFFIERNAVSYSHQVHNILKTYCEDKILFKPICSVKGEMSDRIDLSNLEKAEKEFIRFMGKYFEISNVPIINIPAIFKSKQLHKQENFVVQSIDNFSLNNFYDYYNLWANLQPEKQLILFFHLKPNSLADDITCLPNYCLCRFNDDEQVLGDDFMDLFSGNDFPARLIKLCQCDPMSFADAVIKLEEYNELI